MFVTSDRKHIAVPWREDVSQLIPHARTFDYGSEKLLLIPNGHDEAKVCRNLGVPVPAPILTRYDWPCSNGQTPWAVQKTTSALLTESPRAYVLSSMGVGKTRSAIWAADYLLRAGAIKRVLIAAPLSTLTPVWEQELFRLLPQARVRVLYGTFAKRLALLNEDAEWFIINHHGLNILKDSLVTRGFGALIIDELAVFRNKSTTLWKSATTVVGSTQYAWGLTGSPTPTAPTDAWGQIRLLTPDRTTRTMGRFKDQTMRQITQFKWVARQGATEIVREAMQPSVRFAREDVMELPETIYADRKVALEGDAARAYKTLFDKMVMLTNKGETVTAANEGVLQSKLLQVSCGFIYSDDRKVYKLPNTSRLNVLLETVRETDRKVIVFVPFIYPLESISEFLTKHGETTALVYGATARAARDRIFRKFQEESEPRVLVAHPACMAHGLTLTAANTIVWYSPTNSLEIYEQANARITRPGQTSKTLIAHLIASPVERATYARLRERAKMQGMLLELFRSQELEF